MKFLLQITSLPVDPRNPSTSDWTTISTVQMKNIVESLKLGRNCSGTRKNYHTIWKLFANFYFRLDTKPDNWEDRIMLFVGYLIENKKNLPPSAAMWPQ